MRQYAAHVWHGMSGNDADKSGAELLVQYYRRGTLSGYELLDSASTDKSHFDAAIAIVREAREAGEPCPAGFENWCADMVAGLIPKPTKGERVNAGRDGMFRWASLMVMTHYSVSATAAADVVNDLLTDLRRTNLIASATIDKKRREQICKGLKSIVTDPNAAKFAEILAADVAECIGDDGELIDPPDFP